MANPGLGYRTAADVLMEVSFHLLEPTVYTTITSFDAAGFGDGGYGDGGYGDGIGYVIGVTSTNAMYAGVQVVIGWKNSDAEVVTVIAVQDATHFVAVLANAHSIGETVLSPTFPIQEGTDPIFTQPEMLMYLARAQNEFLTAVPCFYERFFQNVNQGIVYQNTPATSILIDRIAASPINIPIQSMVRVNNVVTLATTDPTNLIQYNTFAVVNASDPSFDGVFAVTASSTSGTGFGVGGFGGGGFGGGGYALTYNQVGADGAATGGFIQSMRRLYEMTQEELTQQNRSWQVNYTNPLKAWFEDRAGLYRWGVGGIPQSTYPVELLCAIRDSDTLGLLDGFLIPDVVIHGVKYLAMNYALSKDGVMQEPQMAEFCMKRYAQIVMATGRYIEAMKIGVQQ